MIENNSNEKLSKNEIKLINPDSIDEQKELELKIAETEAYLKNRQAFFKYSLWIGIATSLVLALGVFAYTMKFFASYGITKNWLISIAIGGGYGFLLYALYYYVKNTQLSSIRSELDLLDVRRRILTRLKPSNGTALGSPPTSYFDSLVRINVENLAAYYSLMKNHTDNSFRVSLMAGIVGFILILLGLVLGFARGQNNQTISFISAGAGIVIEFISGVFFYLYNRTVIRLKDYHDSLLAVQNILLSFKIIGDIQDEKEKARMASLMIGFLVGKHTQIQPSTDKPQQEQS